MATKANKQQNRLLMTKDTNEKVKLGYWNIRGNASQIRYLMVYLGVDYEDVVYEQGEGPEFDRSAWTNVRDTLGLQFPNLPYMIDGNVKLTETYSIMKYIASKYGPQLLGTDAITIGKVEMVASQVSDLKGAVTLPCYTSGDRSSITNSLLTKVEPIVRFMGSNKFMVGNDLTYIDFVMFELCLFM